MNQIQSSRQYYNRLLTSAIPNREFIARLSMLLDNDPYFMPGYLEHIWFAEADGDTRSKYALLRLVQKKINDMYFDSALRTKILQRWTVVERDAMSALLTMGKRTTRSWFTSARLSAQQVSVEYYFPLQNQISRAVGTHLKCIQTLDGDRLKNIQQEIQGLAPYWWGIDRTRSNIVHHQHTRAITVRYLPSHTVPYTPVDGVHESVPSVFIERFPLLHEAILQFAEVQKLGLGRVAVVAMRPYQQSYRHYDSEEYLSGRYRYHMILQAGEKNLLSAGSDEVYAKEGEVWFFDNHVMHRAHNDTPVERIHVIFDGYPL